jgi:GNAT superfamily N-acetyltransferase
VKQVPHSTGYEIRSYRDNDEAEVLDLLAATLGGGPAGRRPPEYFRWKHQENPFGRSYMLLAEADGRIVGLRAFMRWRFQSGNRVVRAVRAVDTATHPDYQGRGIFSRLTREAVEELRDQADLIFNTPNEKSLPGYLKMGWQIVGAVPVSVRIRRPIAFVRGFRDRRSTSEPARSAPLVSAEPVPDALSDPEIPSLLSEAAGASDRLLATPRDLEYLRWRYAAATLLGYRAIRARERGKLAGICVFRVRPRGPLWESTVAEVLVRPADRGTARRLLRGVAAAAPVDHVTFHYPHASAAARGARMAGFLRAPGGMMFVVNELNVDNVLDATQLDSWALSLGDLEVF